jgi:uncharacterized protein (TIGR02594 family)
MNQNVLKVQTRLKELGFDPGPLDGVRGRATITAVRKFQAARGLTVDGLVGSQTYSALFGAGTVSKTQYPDTPIKPPTVAIDAAPWMAEARRVMGLHEQTHKKSLWDWMKSDGGKTVGDPAQVPWCGDFVQTAIALSMPEEPIPANPYLAANWTKFGIPCTPQHGAVLVFWRGSPESWKGHVGFYTGETATHFRVLGGNQSDRVSEVLIAKNRIREGGVRWPSTALPPTGSRVTVNGAGMTITTNEA